jgi:2-phospho-L-lactate guanylyltransferase
VVRANGERIDFEEYLVREGAPDDIADVDLSEAALARPAPGVVEAIAAAERLLICPSNPVVSIGTIRALPEIEAALRARRDAVCVSPLIGGAPVKGPADRLLRAIGAEVSSLGVARLYRPIGRGIVIDRVDAPLSGEIVAAVVPFKRLTRAKRRLRSRYAPSEVEALGRAMLLDVLTALGGAKSLEATIVLTDDPAVASAAREAGARVRLRTPDAGLNPTIEAASAELARQGFDAVLVVLGDLPLLRCEDVDAVAEVGQRESVVIVPSSDGGTAMLLRRPPDRIPARFGPESAAAHAREARALGIEPGSVPAIAEATRIDLDTPEDAERLLAAGVPCRTRDLLRELAR